MRFNFTLLSAFAACAVAIDHAVTVGGDKLDIYSPVEIKAEKGDTVTFQFLTGTHDIIQSTFNKPCEPMFGGFYSSIISVNQTAKARASTASLVPPSYVLPITDTLPQWFYCSRGDHCKKGMVGVINPSSSQDQTLENYKIAAKIVAKAVRPGVSSASRVVLNTSFSTSSSRSTSASTSRPGIVSTSAASSPTSSFANSTMSATTTSSTVTISPSGATSTTSQRGTTSTSSTAPRTTTGAAASNIGGSAVGLVALVAGAIIFG